MCEGWVFWIHFCDGWEFFPIGASSALWIPSCLKSHPPSHQPAQADVASSDLFRQDNFVPYGQEKKQINILGDSSG